MTGIRSSARQNRPGPPTGRISAAIVETGPESLPDEPVPVPRMVKGGEPSVIPAGGRALTPSVSVRAVGRVSRVTGLIIGIGWVLLLPLGFIGAGGEPIELVQLLTVPWLLPGVLLAVRAPMIGVKIDGSTLKIVSWWRNYDIDCDLIDEILLHHYSGYLNNWGDGDVMGRYVKVLGVESNDRDRYFPATAMTNTVAEAVVPQIARALGVPFTSP
ncbi:hypothetical protein [Mycetocola sp.]|uniref:hypothetical protein n=1 Tax=Mycetocola sp. TaxID=1871042 RepID=UPI00398985E4